MTKQSDQQLLLAYAKHRSESALTELVRRHVDLVYSTALRIVRDQHLAEDVTQGVFVAFERNAGQLTSRAVLSGWLHRTAHNLAVNAVRTEERRRAREKEAVAMNESLSAGSDAIWERLAPHLDNALGDLSEADRDALLLRFFQRKSAREIAQALDLTEEAAQKRVTRALERLRVVLASRGLAMAGTLLATTLSAQAVQAAPLGLSAGLAADAFAQSAAVPALGSSLLQPIKFMAQLKAKPVAASLMIVACLSLGTTGFVVGKTAAKKHYAAMAWREALLHAPEPEPIANRAESTTSLASETESLPAVQQPSVSEILLEAAGFFRLQERDPDAWAKGMVALEKLRQEDATEAVRQLETYRTEPAVFHSMAPFLMGLWAPTDPRAALQHSLANFKSNTLAVSLNRVTQAWARQEPDAAWAWYRETTHSGQRPVAEGAWTWLVKPLFTEWVGRDAAGAFEQFAKVSLAEERTAIHGIADSVKNADHRPAILAAIDQVLDDGKRQRLAAEVADEWAGIDPQSAAEWAAGLAFQNPAARLHVMSEAFEAWWESDPHSAAVWVLTQAPGEAREQFKHLLKPEQRKKLLEAAR